MNQNKVKTKSVSLKPHGVLPFIAKTYETLKKKIAEI